MTNPILLTMTCPFCSTMHSVKVDETDYFKWASGQSAQKVFTYLNLAEIEQLISRICPKCQEGIFEANSDE